MTDNNKYKRQHNHDKEININLELGDCLKILPTLFTNSVDLLISDLPYGTTACKWDSIIPLKKLWPELNRVCKPSAAMIFTAQQPFTWKLCASNPENFKYELIWEKPICCKNNANETS
jgi:site-specific DNA-methyltransferase (adenine-specific)